MCCRQAFHVYVIVPNHDDARRGWLQGIDYEKTHSISKAKFLEAVGKMEFTAADPARLFDLLDLDRGGRELASDQPVCSSICV